MTSSSRHVVVVAACSLLLLLPLLLSPWPVGQDLPAHIETAAQIAALLRGDADTTARYALHALPWPNSLPTFAIALLLPVVGGVAAGVVVTGLGVLLWPVALALLLQRLQRPPLLALLTLPTAYDLSFSYGFTHFVVGKPLWALTMVAAIDAARTPRLRPLLVLGAALVLLFHTHLLLWASAVPLVVIVAGVQAPTWRARAIVLGTIVLAALPGVWWSFRQPHISGISVYPELSARLSTLWDNLGNLRDGASDGLAWWLVLPGLALVCFSPRTRWATRDTLVAVVLCAAPLAFAAFGPTRTPEASIIAERFWSVAAGCLVIVAPTATLSILRERVAVVLGAAIALSLSVPTTLSWRRFSDEQMGDFEQVLSAVPASSRVATWFVRPLSPHARHNALWHWPKLVSLAGSSTDDAFAWRATCVLGLRDGVRPPAHPALTAAALSSWTHLLVQGHSAALDRQLQALHLEQLVHTGEWRLFSIPHTP
jgi:hypothetical protein